ncbi:hypothetical protein [Aquimarina latercula]|uniref:hypothetical protein n=1 Tax=Aquimarina latercula TaxID=987 RepID=UPI000407096F|nr:hypothetical protein [Aquimarina latercula]
MKTYFNQLDIHTNHIFDFETDCYFIEPIEYEKRQTRRIIVQLIERLNIKIISSVKSTESPDNIHFKNITITSKHTDFDYWFALKLRQYQMSLKNIPKFLDYHLSKSFNNDKKHFNEFLKLTLLQYQKIFFNKKVSKMVKNYLNTNLVSIKHTFQNNKPRKPKTNYQTLILKGYQNDTSFIKNNIVYFVDILYTLKKENFIHKKTSFESFKNIFKDQPIESSDRIKWTGTIKELQWFVKYLVYDSKKVVDLDKDIWLVTMRCFVNKTGEEFTESQLRNASGNNITRKRLLESILVTI